MLGASGRKVRTPQSTAAGNTRRPTSGSPDEGRNRGTVTKSGALAAQWAVRCRAGRETANLCREQGQAGTFVGCSLSSG